MEHKQFFCCTVFSFIFLMFFIPHHFLFSGPQKELLPGKRAEITLNGDWEVYHTSKPDASPPGNKWEQAAVPRLYSSTAVGGSRYTWYRRTITIPQVWENQRIFLCLKGARYDPHVFINKQFCGKQLDGWTPFEVEITKFTVPGKAYTLSIRCRDWGATFENGYSLPEGTSEDWFDLRGTPKGKIIAPIGGLFTYYGIWDDVFLRTRPRAYLSDIAINTSVRKNTLTIQGSCSYTKRDFYVGGEVLDRNKPVLLLAPAKTGKGGKWTLSAPASGIRYWSPEDPYLYTLKVYLKQMKDSAVIDTFQTRFGFRELWADGPDFYLNGIKRRLLASSGWPESYYQPDEEIRSSLTAMKQGNTIAFRFHTQPWQSKWLDIADEAGVLIIEEGALWCDSGCSYAYENEEFWENTWAHLKGMVTRDRNHPSLVMWSLENEILQCGAGNCVPDVEEKLAGLGHKVKQFDPAHLITYEADLDPGGAADVIGLHYPHEMPDYTDYPNTAEWLDRSVMTGTGGGLMGSWEKEFSWNRKKPLYIGEYLWIPYNDYSPGTVFFGDHAYINLEDYKLKAKALSWEYQTLAYRRAGVSGMCPWTSAGNGGKFNTGNLLFQTQKKVYEPVAAFPRDTAVHFYAGEKISRTIDLFNDSALPHTLDLRCTLQGQGKIYDKTFTLKPGGYKEVTVPVTLPATVSPEPGLKGKFPGQLLFSIDLIIDGKIIHSSSQYFTIFKKQSLKIPPGYTLLFYDPGKIFINKAKIPVIHGQGSIPPVMLDTLNELAGRNPDSDLLIIGPYAFKENLHNSSIPVIGKQQEDFNALYTFMKNGGRVFVMEQETLLRFIGGISLVPHASTLTFPLDTAHPIFAGLSLEDFRFWQPDHDNHYKNYVTTMEITRPAGYGGRALLVSGGVRCLDQSPFVELPYGQGRIIFSQALVGTKYRKEPVAHIIIQNTLDYLASLQPKRKRTIVLSRGNNGQVFTDKLKKIGVSFTHHTEPIEKGETGNASLIILHGGGEVITSSASALKEYLYSPGKILYWHLPEKETFKELKRIFGISHLSLGKGSGPLILRGTDQPLFSGICREDLIYIDKEFWTGAGKNIVIDPEIIESSVSIETGPENSITYEIEEWNLEGNIVYVSGNKKEVVFLTNGTASRNIHVQKPGIYPVSLKAYGTPANGVWPLARISVNGNPTAFLHITGEEPALYSTIAEFPRGDILVEISFINDLYSQGQDRNLYIDAFLFASEPADAETLQFLTLPAGVVECRINDSSRFIIDTIQWHANEKNRLKGLRYASVLMENMGASFKEPEIEPEWISPNYFSIVGEIYYYNQSEDQFAFYSAGTIKAEFSCARESTYNILIRASSTEVDDVFSIVRVTVDDIVTGETEIKSLVPDVFPVGSCFLEKGKHIVFIEYINDEYQDNADRNLFFQAIGFE